MKQQKTAIGAANTIRVMSGCSQSIAMKMAWRAVKQNDIKFLNLINKMKYAKVKQQKQLLNENEVVQIIDDSTSDLLVKKVNGEKVRVKQEHLEPLPIGNSKHFGMTKNGYQVYDRKKSHIARDVLPNLVDVIPQIEPAENFQIIEYDFGKVIGKTYCVELTEKDRPNIYYKRRKYREGQTKFVRYRQPDPTQYMTIILKKIDEGYLVITAFNGRIAEPEPWDENAFKQDPRGYEAAKAASEKFWNNHALIETIRSIET